LYSVNPEHVSISENLNMSDLNHDAVMRIGGRLLGGGSILQKRHNGQDGFRRTATSDR